jgi:hypothetical protein
LAGIGGTIHGVGLWLVSEQILLETGKHLAESALDLDEGGSTLEMLDKGVGLGIE